MDAGPGIEPGSEAYEASELPLLYPAITGQGGKNRTCTTRFQTSATTTIIHPANWSPMQESNLRYMVPNHG